MPVNKILKREMQVAFAKHVQPVWLRILKYLVPGFIIFIFWGTNLLPIILIIVFGAAFAVHFWFRYKTRGWTRSYGAWKYENNPE